MKKISVIEVSLCHIFFNILTTVIIKVWFRQIQMIAILKGDTYKKSFFA